MCPQAPGLVMLLENRVLNSHPSDRAEWTAIVLPGSDANAQAADLGPPAGVGEGVTGKGGSSSSGGIASGAKQGLAECMLVPLQQFPAAQAPQLLSDLLGACLQVGGLATPASFSQDSISGLHAWAPRCAWSGLPASSAHKHFTCQACAASSPVIQGPWQVDNPSRVLTVLQALTRLYDSSASAIVSEELTSLLSSWLGSAGVCETSLNLAWEHYCRHWEPFLALAGVLTQVELRRRRTPLPRASRIL